jgi:NOL1/NOP2/sun family putative RNA methylase
MKGDSKKEDIIIKINSIFEPQVAHQVVENITLPKAKTFRINPLKFYESDTLDSVKEFIEPAELPNTFKVKGDYQISKSKLNEDKKIYIQELSSMLPVLVLDPKEGEVILDMCASPGSKASQVQGITKNKSKMVAVEKSLGRFYKLKEIVLDLGCKNIDFIHSDANYLPKRFPETVGAFDKVMLDAPCSNEGGIVLSEPSTYKYWSSREGKQISKLQKGLLNTAGKLVRIGGEIVYSTCTFSVEENEEVVDWFLKRNDNFSIEEVILPIPNVIPGVTKYKEREFSEDAAKSCRILPNDEFKGFFLAKLRRNS